MKPAIRVHQLACSYYRTPVLRDLTFAVNPGECFIVIGPNGSGKTTLIKTLAGLLPVSGGDIFVQDRPLRRHKKADFSRRVAYVAQTGAEDSPFSVREMVLMGRAPYLGVLGVEGAADLEIARQAIAFTGLSHLSGRPMASLSGGERQRAHIARAICQRPEIILLDEPTAALDLAHQIRIMDLMAGLKNEHGTTVVMVSHDINLAAMYADRLLLLVEGRAAACGPPAEVIDEKRLAGAYGCRLLVDRSPAGPWPRVSLVPDTEVGGRKSEV
ncbi:iron ABC transporter ATP-binding protein [Desulfosarcina alkanivorans]|uniref:Iron ABC transporter ATP-binding protein n=1 Tax=Desulfosarcina alkanivorans TaxID=571177 RepID=A0A5K7YGQ9_9BACT|nr:ABC transporter ATP-binding protein [Desulfosarcina alkanivorans]BBO67605.1 iron ABC transporter ATP-binding protein [Desulfosarcina alkanivorans]